MTRGGAHQLNILWDGKDILECVELKLVEVLVGSALNFELPPIDALR